MAELLAPAGSIMALKAAVFNGADAVYLGLDNYNARIKANEFTRENISEWVRFCHLYGVKVYITLNTNVKNDEFDDVALYITACDKANVDAFIITDLGLLGLLEMYAPSIPLHASTQMGTHNYLGAKYLEQLGFSRVVVARETTMQDIIEIKKNTTLEVEYFVHGALCVAFSGNCLFSSILNGNSGNRGRCLQPCRLKYKNLLSGEEKYYLSPSDQCLIEKISELEKIGIDSFKIEGRLKRAEYVAEVVGQYAKILFDGRKKSCSFESEPTAIYHYGIENSERYLNESTNTDTAIEYMKTVYNRGDFTKGYLYDETCDIMSVDIQSHKGLEIGKVIACKTLSTNYEVKIETTRKINDGDGIKFIFEGIEQGGRDASTLKEIATNTYLAYNSKPLLVGTRIYLTTDSLRNKYLLSLERKLPIKMHFEVLNNFGFLTLQYNNISVIVKTEKPLDEAKKVATKRDEIILQLERLGDTKFTLKEFTSNYDEKLFIPKSIINYLRREGIYAVENEILNSYDKFKAKRKHNERSINIRELDTKNVLILALSNKEVSLPKDLREKCLIVLEIEDFTLENCKSVIKNALICNYSSKLLLKLPNFASHKTLKILEELSIYLIENKIGIYANSTYALYFAATNNLEVAGGLGLNIYNNRSMMRMGLKDSVVLSAELNNSELQKFSSNCFVFVYGYLPLMTLRHCPIKLAKNCTCSDCEYKGEFYYRDRLTSFAIRREKAGDCSFVLYNSLKHNLSEKISRIKQKYFLNLTNISDNEKVLILNSFIDKTPYFDKENTTNGHFFRGVE